MPGRSRGRWTTPTPTGVVHRDIKPENILLSAGQALVADFGIAKALDAAGGEKLTETGLSLGTPYYMSPEQASATRSLDGRSDLYALGCVLYEMLAGAPPFTGPSAQSILARHSVDPVPSLHTVRGTVPAGIEWAITKAMAKVPADRFAYGRRVRGRACPSRAGAGARGREGAAICTPGLAVGAVVLVVGLGGAPHCVDWVGGRSAPSSIAGGPAAEGPVGRLGVGRRHDGGPDHRSRPDQRAAGHLALGGDEVQGAAPCRSRRSRGTWGWTRCSRAVSSARGTTCGWTFASISAALGASALGPTIRRADSATARPSATPSRRAWCRALKLSVTSSEERQLHAPPTTNAEAYDSFLRGKIHVKQENRSEDSIAIGLFEHAVALDPNFAAAHAELAHAYGLRAFYFAAEDKEAMERGLVAAEKALRLDPELAEGHYARGFLLWTPASHFAHEQAIQEYKRAIELNPNLYDVHRQLALVSMHIGLFEQAHEEFRKALALDPSNRIAQFQDGGVFGWEGNYGEALRIYRQVPRDFNPSLWAKDMSWTLLELGRDQEASSIIEEYLDAFPKDPGGVVTSMRAILHAKAGQARAAETDIARAVQVGEGFGHFHHTAHYIASAYALLRQPGPAVQWLRRAADTGLPCYPLFDKDPNLANLRQDPGYLALMAELKAQWERWKAL